MSASARFDFKPEEVRALAAAAPTLPEAPVDDPDESVCRAAAADPSLTPEVLEALLADPRTAEGAAANPSLPVSRMHALLDRCLNGDATPTDVGGTPRGDADRTADRAQPTRRVVAAQDEEVRAGRGTRDQLGAAPSLRPVGLAPRSATRMSDPMHGLRMGIMFCLLQMGGAHEGPQI